MQVVAYAVFIFIAGAPRDTETTLTAFLHSSSSLWPSGSGLSSSLGYAP